MPQTILIVDDEPDVVTGFRRVLAKDDVTLEAAASGEEALRRIKNGSPDLVIMDLRMPGLDGIGTLRRMREIDPRLLIILMTAYSTTATVIEAMKCGAYDFLAKPFHVERLRETVRAALRTRQEMLHSESHQPVLRDDEASETLIGKSPPMQEVFKTIGQVAASEATVLVTGESGTGKELVARAIHQHSERSKRPFIAVNCAAIPEALLESELFGHEKGAFTGAIARRPGRFEQADNGSLFLDEIGDMPLATQAKVLRVLQSGEFERVGGTETLHTNVRLIAATNRDLESMIADATFRTDLYYRLNVVRVRLPSLRERPDDIPVLIEYFLRRQTPTGGKTPQISAAAMEKLAAYHWPGNVRELENVVRKIALTSKGEAILPGSIQFDHGPTPPRAAVPAAPTQPPATLDEALSPLFDLIIAARADSPDLDAFDIVRRSLIVQALLRTRGNQLRAAKLLGITRSTLRKSIVRYGLAIESTIRSND